MLAAGALLIRSASAACRTGTGVGPPLQRLLLLLPKPQVPGRAEQRLPARRPDRQVDGQDLQSPGRDRGRHLRIRQFRHHRPAGRRSHRALMPKIFHKRSQTLAQPANGARGHRRRQRPPERGRGQAGRARRGDQEVSRPGGAGKPGRREAHQGCSRRGKRPHRRRPPSRRSA